MSAAARIRGTAPAATATDAAHRRALTQVLLGVTPLALTLWLAAATLRPHWAAEDFTLAYYPAAHRLLAGLSPYAATHAQVLDGAAFVYPALAAVALAPFALLTIGVSYHLWVMTCLAMVPGTLWLAGVRDWRVYGAVFLWYPIVAGWQGENVSVPMMYMLALAWRHRDRPLIVGLVCAAAISIKPFVWPLLLWLLATRRWRAAAWSLVAAITLNVIAWAIVGPGAVLSYLKLAAEDSAAQWRGGYGVMAVAHHLGLSRGPAELLLALVAVALTGALLRSGLGCRDDRASFVVAIGVMLVASPLVWIHYLVLLALALALLRPRLAAVWLVPIVLWLLPPATRVEAWQEALAWMVVAGCLVAALRAPGQPAERRPQVRLMAGG